MFVSDFRELIEYASDPAIVVDGRQRVLAINKAATLLLGRSALEASALTCDQLLGGTRPEGEPLCCRDCEAMTGLRMHKPFLSERCVLRGRDGNSISASLRTIAVPGDTNDLYRPVAVIFISRTPEAEAVEADGDGRLTIHTFGRFAVSFRGSFLPLERWPRKQAIELLKLLVTHIGRPVHRELLIEHFWPDSDAQTGWNRLKVTVHFLRQRLRDAGFPEDVITTDDSSYILRSDCVWIDAVAFESRVRTGRAHQRGGRIREAIRSYEYAQQLYRGDYMEGDLYADWCAEERARLCEVYLELLNALAELHFSQGEYASAAQDCLTALVREPCRESLHRLLMRSLIALGRIDSAIKHYRRCCRVLKDELDVLPAAETVAVIAPILGSGAALEQAI